MYLLSSGETRHLTGLSERQLNEWTTKGIIKPQRGGKGQGDPRRWTPMQVLGILVANEVRNTERGCVLKYAGQVFDAFTKVDEEWLTKSFENGATHLVLVHKGRPVLDGKASHRVDVQKAYRKVQKHVKQLTKGN